MGVHNTRPQKELTLFAHQWALASICRCNLPKAKQRYQGGDGWRSEKALCKARRGTTKHSTFAEARHSAEPMFARSWNIVSWD